MQIFNIMLTSHDTITSIQLSINCNLTFCIFQTRHDIKNLTGSSHSVALKTSETKLEGIPSKDVEGDTF